ncbi:rmlC-like jelly roll fold protein [Artemisia annua]|uniref:RmlC-like jelly roll fold protein n=1 Tax=Artemisia annua TaxID=35608 RepID=A0A2U1NPL3_ARTAN|nr:rmlC-like jelly roll fold protein [Artemisia annua]
MSLTTSEIIAKLNLIPNSEGGFFVETFRDTSINLTTSQLPSRFKVDRPISTAIYFFLPTGNVSNLHRIPSAETWHFYLGEPITILEIDDKNGSVKFTNMGQDIVSNQVLQYTVRPDVWFGAFPSRDFDIVMDNKLVRKAPRNAEKHFSLVGTTVAPAFEVQDFVLAKRSELISRFPALKSLISALTPSD